jgi:squalene-hopene/tetraprenyl-beta-curcumene cyclase
MYRKWCFMTCHVSHRGRFITFALLTSFLVTCCTAASAAKDTQATTTSAKISQAVNRGADFLKQAQGNDGSFSPASGPGVTAIVATALLRSGRSPNDPVVARALKYLEANLHEDGGIYQKGSNHKNYETCLAIVAFQEANRNHKYDKLLADAEKFVKKEQWDEDEQIAG